MRLLALPAELYPQVFTCFHSPFPDCLFIIPIKNKNVNTFLKFFLFIFYSKFLIFYSKFLIKTELIFITSPPQCRMLYEKNFTAKRS